MSSTCDVLLVGMKDANKPNVDFLFLLAWAEVGRKAGFALHMLPVELSRKHDVSRFCIDVKCFG